MTNPSITVRPNVANVVIQPTPTRVIEVGGNPGNPGNGVTWEESTASPIAAQVNTGYLLTANSLQLIALPATATTGDRLLVIGIGSGLFRITQGAGQQIRFNSSLTTLGVTGRIDALDQGGSIALVYGSDGWLVMDSSGNFEVT